MLFLFCVSDFDYIILLQTYKQLLAKFNLFCISRSSVYLFDYYSQVFKTICLSLFPFLFLSILKQYIIFIFISCTFLSQGIAKNRNMSHASNKSKYLIVGCLPFINSIWWFWILYNVLNKSDVLCYNYTFRRICIVVGTEKYEL